MIDVINERLPADGDLYAQNKNHFVVRRGLFRFHPRLANLLGVDPNKTLEPSEKNPYDFDREVHHRSIYVYGDFIEPQLVGDSMSPLLCRIGVDNPRRGQYLTFSPRHLCYLPVTGGLLHSPLVYLCDETGSEVKFQNGIVSILLHFRHRL